MQAKCDALTSNAPTLHTKLISAVEPSMQSNKMPEVSNLKRFMHQREKTIIKNPAFTSIAVLIYTSFPHTTIACNNLLSFHSKSNSRI